MLLLGCLVIGLAAFVHARPGTDSRSSFCYEDSMAINILESDLSRCVALIITRRYQRDPQHVLLNTTFFEKLPATIRDVYLQDNNITEISSGDFKRFRVFMELILADNKIKQLKKGTLVNFASLKQLSLSSNEIETIEPGFFEDLLNLGYIDLSNNKITHLEEGVFKGLVNIQYIRVEFNKLSAISANIFSTLPMRLILFSYSNSTLEIGTSVFGKTCLLSACDIDLCVNDICHVVDVYRKEPPYTEYGHK